MKIYVASGLENRARAADVIARLVARGHTTTYDWTQHGDVRDRGEAVMAQTAQNEIEAVRDAALVLLLLPGGKGTHTELGTALASRANKRIWLWAEQNDAFGGGGATCVFYHHPAIERICCSYEALCARVDGLEG